MTKQIINIGTTANDGTGDTIRAAFDICNDNFGELYNRMGCVAGTGSEQVINAVKYFEISEIGVGDLFYIGGIIAGRLSGSNYTYTVDIWKTTSLASYGELVCRYTTSAPTSPKTGLELIILGEYDGSGIYGRMIINWSQLTQGNEYQLDDWSEGGIFAVNSMSPRTVLSDNQTLIITATEQTLDGAVSLYVFNPAGDITASISAIASLKGAINIKNISAHNVDISGAASETFDGGGTSIRVAAGKSISITPYDGNFILSAGEYAATP